MAGVRAGAVPPAIVRAVVAGRVAWVVDVGVGLERRPTSAAGSESVAGIDTGSDRDGCQRERGGRLDVSGRRQRGERVPRAGRLLRAPRLEGSGRPDRGARSNCQHGPDGRCWTARGPSSRHGEPSLPDRLRPRAGHSRRRDGPTKLWNLYTRSSGSAARSRGRCSPRRVTGRTVGRIGAGELTRSRASRVARSPQRRVDGPSRTIEGPGRTKLVIARESYPIDVSDRSRVAAERYP